VNGKAETHFEPELALAMQLTGGYVDYLRENASELLSQIEFSDEAKKLCARLAKFTAHMRARPSTRQEEHAEREFATRLTVQLGRLAGCLALVLNCKSVDAEVLRRVQQVALDTSRGQTLALVAHLYEYKEGLRTGSLAELLGKGNEKLIPLLRFLEGIGVVKHLVPNGATIKGKARWTLSNKLRRLYHDIVDQPITHLTELKSD
jgi:hypothetical protein